MNLFLVCTSMLHIVAIRMNRECALFDWRAEWTAVCRYLHECNMQILFYVVMDGVVSNAIIINMVNALSNVDD